MKLISGCTSLVYAALFSVFCSIAWASPSETTHWLEWVDQQALHERGAWRKVMYYEKKIGGWRSQTTDPDFFFADNGASNPKAELHASLVAFLTDHPDLGDDAAQCRFPRRFDWLTSQLPSTVAWPDIECPALSAFIEQAAPLGMTLVYPTSYLNNPASMFGHTFIRIDAEKEGRQRNALLALTVSYGADVSPNENGFVYAFKGLTGLYPGSVRSHPYYLQVQNYNELESRDIWEYPLNLSAVQAETFIKAGWDLKDVNFNYAYLLKNCSYRLLSVMEAAFPEYDLLESFDVYAVPIDTLRALNQAGLLAQPEYRPAIASRIAYMANLSSGRQKAIAQSLVDQGVDSTLTSELEALPGEAERRVVDLAYEYSRYKAKKADSDMAEVSYDLLRLRAQQPKGQFEMAREEWPQEPLLGHDIRRVALGVGYNEDQIYGRFGFRPVYHDSYDRQAGYLANSQINALASEWRLHEDAKGGVELTLNRFDLVDFRSLSPYSGMMPSLAWTGRLGWSRETDAETTLPLRLDVEMGRAFQTGADSLFFLLASTELNTLPEIRVGAHLGWMATLPKESRLGLETRMMTPLDTDEWLSTTQLIYNRPFSKDTALRFRLETDDLLKENRVLGGSIDFHWFF